jgi:serine/threonine protein kinase
MLSLPPPGERARAGSLPPTARRSADHGRALRAADELGLRLAKKLVQRPLMSVWDAVQSDEKHVTLTVVDACATEGERKRILAAASSLKVLAGTEGVQSLHTVAEPVEAFVADACQSGTAADLVVLRWPLRERIAFVVKVCEALEAIHAAGLVHGGLCPDNVLLDDGLGPVLSEIGMVSLAESLEGDREGFFGYGGYASPEAQDGAALDARSDVFSVGRLFAFLLTEHEPDDATERELTEKSPALTAIYRRATAASPADRPDDATMLRADLERLRGEALATAPAPVRHTLPRMPKFSAAAPSRASVGAPAPVQERPAPAVPVHKPPVPAVEGGSRVRLLAFLLVLVLAVATAYLLMRR